jgi:hypothetical protein
MMKKLLKSLGIIFIVTLGILILIPFFLESKIDAIVKNYAEQNLNAELDFRDVNLSLIKSIPNAEVSVEELKITNRAPFEDDILATAKDISFKMPIKELFKGTEEPLIITDISAEELLLTLKSNQNGTTNYDIVIQKEAEASNGNESSSGFSFDVENYSIINSAFTYINEENNSTIYLTEVNHQGKGIFSGNRSELDTKTSAKVSLSVDSTTYLNNTLTKLDALIELDLENNTYRFKDNKALINALPLEFAGFVKLLDAGQETDLKFTNPESNFRDFLAIVPEQYANNLENVETSGDFSVNGTIKGLLSETTIPNFSIQIVSDNASFKYPSLPKKAENITINAEIVNTTGLSQDTYIDVNAFNFKIDEDSFRSEAHIKNLSTNMKVNATLNGTLNLANIAQTYPLKLENQLTGILKLDLTTNFDMDAISSNTYSRIKNSGRVAISNFVFSSDDIPHPFQINNADLSFTPGMIDLNNLEARTGSSDISAKGSLRNLLGFLLSDKKLQGNFNVRSDSFTISDFMAKDTSDTPQANDKAANSESPKIPEFLDCTITANAKKVVYDNLILNNVKGDLRIKDQKADVISLTSDLFDGKLVMSGNISTNEKQPTFNVNLGMQEFNISQSFKELKMLEALAPIANVLQGRLNAAINVNGLLDATFSPELNTIAGDAQAKLMTEKVMANASPMLNGLANNLNFIDLKEFKLNDVETELSFKDGSVLVAPFTVKYKDIPVEISGTHSFDNQMNYKAVLQVPAKYLGSDVNRLIGQINDTQVNAISVPVTAKISGTFAQPKIATDLSSSISNLTNQLIDIQKQKLLNTGSEKVNSFIDDLLGGKKDDSSSTDNKAKDSTKITTEETLKKKAGSLLNNLIKAKSSKESSDKKKDSIKKNGF